MPAKWRIALVSLLVVLALSGGAPCLAMDASDVLVLYNSADPDGASIANYYTAIHPGARKLALTNVPTSEQITYDVYLNTIRPQVLAGLDHNVDCIVTTKGLPLRIQNTNPDPVTYKLWSQYSSLESELTRIDTINSRILMGNQNYNKAANLGGNPLAYNPYRYAAVGETAFDYDIYGIRLTSRLDGYTLADVKASLDRAQRAVYDRPGYTFLVDNGPGTPTSTKMPDLVTVLQSEGMPYTYDNTSTFIRNVAGAVLGYVSKGTNGGAPSSYLTNPATGLQFRPADGAVFDTWESYNAYTFRGDGNNPKYGQGLIAQWLRYGGTAGVGNVEEPTSSFNNVTNENLMFRMLLDGYTFAEAAWNATTQLSFVNTIVGDPLMRWNNWQPGDADLNGAVDLDDYDMFLTALTEPGTDWMLGDFDFNGVVDYDDYDIFLTGYTSQAGLRSMVLGAPGLDGLVAGNGISGSIPEPATMAILTISSIVLLTKRKRQI